MLRASRISGISLLWWRNRVRLLFPIDGKTVNGLWEEIKAGLFHLSCSTSFNGNCGAIQCNIVHSHNTGALWLCILGRQPSHLWHLQGKLRYQQVRKEKAKITLQLIDMLYLTFQTNIHKSQPVDSPNHILHYSISKVWWSIERGFEWVSNQLSAIS